MTNREEFKNGNENGNHVSLKEFMLDKMDIMEKLNNQRYLSYEQKHEQLVADIAELKTAKDIAAGKASQLHANISIAIALISLIIAIIQKVK